MLQVIQNYRTGAVSVWDVPVPRCPLNGILVRNRASLISLGTERATIELGRLSLLGKARARPDLVKRVIEKARRDGIVRTYHEAMGRLDTPTPLGYSCAGQVIEAGVAAHEFSPGDRVACIGQGYASHADFISVPANLAAKIPQELSDQEAAFGMLGVIALHGVRSANLTFGSNVAVLGLGLLGLLSVQLLRAYGCRVFAMDPVLDKTVLARRFGAEIAVTSEEALIEATANLTGKFGCDAVIVAAATKSEAPIHTAVRLVRAKGRIVVVGVADIHPNRNELWQKEIELVVSRAGGPGAFDPIYEQQGIDLPIADVRWTQNRNLEEFLRLVAEKRIDLAPLITHSFPIAEAESVYSQLITAQIPDAIGVLLEYPAVSPIERRVVVPASVSHPKSGKLRIGAIGAGLFGRALLLPALQKTPNVSLDLLVASSGASAAHSAKRFGFRAAATDDTILFTDDNIDAIIAATPHSQHAVTVFRAIESGKHLFIEKPLCTTPEELDEITTALKTAQRPSVVMVGHNRRYSTHVAAMREWLADRAGPLVLSVRINVGFIAGEHWVHSGSAGT